MNRFSFNAAAHAAFIKYFHSQLPNCQIPRSTSFHNYYTTDRSRKAVHFSPFHMTHSLTSPSSYHKLCTCVLIYSTGMHIHIHKYVQFIVEWMCEYIVLKSCALANLADICGCQARDAAQAIWCSIDGNSNLKYFTSFVIILWLIFIWCF